MPALAYHLNWTTYGTWLAGDARGWVKWGEWGVQPPDPIREAVVRNRLAEPAEVFTEQQRLLVERTIRAHCDQQRWLLHAVNVRSNHIHVVVTADRQPDDVMSQFKAWCSRQLSDAEGLTQVVAKKAGRRRWFTEGGNHKVIDTDAYLANAITYVLERQ